MDSNVAFRRFLLLGKIGEDIGQYHDYVRQALCRYYEWLSPEDKASVAELAGSDIDTILSTDEADPKPLYEVKSGGRDFELRQPMLEMAIREFLENPLQVYGPEGWFIVFARWLNYEEPLQLSSMDPVLHLILLTHQLLAHPERRLEESVLRRACRSWLNVFETADPFVCGLPPHLDFWKVRPRDEDEMRVLTGLMDDVLARLDPPLDRIALCEEPSDYQRVDFESREFQKRWNDLLNLLQDN